MMNKEKQRKTNKEKRNEKKTSVLISHPQISLCGDKRSECVDTLVVRNGIDLTPRRRRCDDDDDKKKKKKLLLF